MPTEDVATARHALMTSAKLLEALAASPTQDEDVNHYAVQHFDRVAVFYVQQLGKEHAADATDEARPRYSAIEGARRDQSTPPRNGR